jgi:hypothetical protein
MGRMILDVLLTFSQSERELIAEHVRARNPAALRIRYAPFAVAKAPKTIMHHRSSQTAQWGPISGRRSGKQVCAVRPPSTGMAAPVM